MPFADFASSRISVPDIAKRLNIGRLAVYKMLEQGVLPGIRLGRRWIVTCRAFEQWEHSCGLTGFQRQRGGNV
jgi:excisionase family DNA binding protein